MSYAMKPPHWLKPTALEPGHGLMPKQQTPKPMQGTWTLTAPDGRTWQADAPIRCVSAEQRERIPAEVALQRIFDAASEDHDWQPIDAAPKDGTTILLWNEVNVTVGGWLTDMDHGADWEGQIGMAGWWMLDESDGGPTHWMPLPPPPGANASDKPKENDRA